MVDLSWVVSWRDMGAARGLKDLADKSAQAEKAQDGLKRSQVEAAAAARKVAIEEAKLKELRESGKAKASQILAAEDRLENARRKEAAATESAAHATSDLTRAQSRQVGSAKRASDGSHSAAASFGKLAGAAKFAGMAGAASLVVAGGAAVKYGVQVAAGNEQAQISFTTMLGSAKKAQDFLTKLQQFAAATPFDFPGLQSAASSLISAGINADKVIPIMRNLGDVTSGMGTGAEGVKRATVALQQMNAAGKIQGQDLAQLRDAGIPVYDLLAAATGKSKAKIAELANAGKLGKKELQQMMDALAGPAAKAGLGRFAGLMDKQSQSLTGLWSTIKDTAGQGLAQAIGPAVPLIKSAMGGVSSALSGVSTWVTKNKSSLGEFFSVVGSTLKSFGTIASSWLKPFMASLTEGGASFKSFADFLGEHQGDITSGLIAGARFAIGFAQALGLMASSGARAFAFLTDAQANVFEVMFSSFRLITHAAAVAFGWIPGVGENFKRADEAFAGFSTGVVAGMHRAADGARTLADGIDNKMNPALAAAKAGLDKVAKTEIDKARNRDAALRLSHAIDAIGVSADGTAIKVHKWSFVQRMSSDEQKALFGRLKAATQAMYAQQDSMKAAGASQAQLTKAWETGRDRLYKEFIQMGLSRDEAKRLADRYASVKPVVQTKFTQPGMGDAKDNADALKRKYRDIPKSVTTKINWDTAVDGFNTRMYAAHGKMALQMSAFEAGGYTGSIDPKRVAGFVHGDEHVTKSASRRKLESSRPGALDYMNRTGEWPGFYGGGRVPSSPLFASVMNAGTQSVIEQGARAVGAALKKLSAGMGGVGGPIGSFDVAHPRALTTYHGRTFTNLFAANLARAERAAGRQFQIYQGGFMPTSSYSGSTHNMDAIDARVDYVLLRAFRRYVGAMGDRTGLGNWMSHMHGVPAPGHGYGAPSAQAQYRDYLRRGGAGQSMKSPWGLAGGGVMVGVAERGPERVLTTRQNRSYERMVRVAEQSGGAVVHNHYTVIAPNYVGSQNELVRALHTLDKQNRLPSPRR